MIGCGQNLNVEEVMFLREQWAIKRKPRKESKCNGQFEAVAGKTQRYKLEAGFDPTPDSNPSYAHGHRSVPYLANIKQQAKELVFFHLRGRSPKIRRGIRLVIPLVFQGRNRFRFLTTMNLGLDPLFG